MRSTVAAVVRLARLVFIDSLMSRAAPNVEKLPCLSTIISRPVI